MEEVYRWDREGGWVGGWVGGGSLGVGGGSLGVGESRLVGKQFREGWAKK